LDLYNRVIALNGSKVVGNKIQLTAQP